MSNELIEVTNLILGKTAPVAAAAIRDAGYQKVPQGYVIVPGPESREAWRQAVERAAKAIWGAANNADPGVTRDITVMDWVRIEADAALRAALNIGEAP